MQRLGSNQIDPRRASEGKGSDVGRDDGKSGTKVKKGSLDDILAGKDGFSGDNAVTAAPSTTISGDRPSAGSVKRDTGNRTGPDKEVSPITGWGRGKRPHLLLGGEGVPIYPMCCLP